MTPKYSKTEVLDIVGTIDVDSNDRYTITIETKEETIVRDFSEILNHSLGEMIAFKVVTEIDE